MMVRTKGQAALARAFALKTVTQAAVASAVEASQPSVCAWASGKNRPDAVQREALRRSYAIPVAWWLTSEERERLGRVRRRLALVSGHAAKMPTRVTPRKMRGWA